MLFCVVRQHFKHQRCAEMLTYNVCKKNLNFEDVRMKKFLVLTAALTEQCNCGVVNNNQVEILTYNVCKRNLNFEDARMKKFLVPTAALLDRCAEMLTYNVCKKNLNFEDERMKKFLVLTVNISQGQSRIPPYPWDILEYVTQ